MEKRNRERVNAQTRLDRINNPEKYSKWSKNLYGDGIEKNNYEIARRRGLKKEEYLQMFSDQENKCAICGMEERRKFKGKLMRLTLDHDHKTGKNRQLLCHACNVGIGHLNHSIELMNCAINYLNSHKKEDKEIFRDVIEIERTRKGIKKGYCIDHGKLSNDQLYKRDLKSEKPRSVCAFCFKLRLKISRLNYQLKKINSEFNSLTREKYLHLLNVQNNKCAICLCKESIKGNDLCIDHDHKKGFVRKLLCRSCNTALGYFKDNVQLLNNSISYLARHS